jgi:hypothetical protein
LCSIVALIIEAYLNNKYFIYVLECWDGEPDNRPSVIDVVKRLKEFSTPQSDMLKIIEEIDIKNSSSHEKSSQLIKTFTHAEVSESNKVNEDNEIKKALVNKIVELIFGEINEEKDQNIRNQNIYDNLNSNKITLLEIYNWLLINQNEPNFIFLLGYFNYFETGTDKNNDEAFRLFNKASKENHILSQ